MQWFGKRVMVNDKFIHTHRVQIRDQTLVGSFIQCKASCQALNNIQFFLLQIYKGISLLIKYLLC